MTVFTEPLLSGAPPFNEAAMRLPREGDTGSAPVTTRPLQSVIPQNFVFLDQASAPSGRVASSSVRRLIRSHVMREYRKKALFSAREDDTLTTKGSSKNKPAASKKPKASELSTKEKGFAATAQSRCSEQVDSVLLERRKPEKGLNSHSQLLNNVVDGFVYAGVSPLDIKSYGLFNHYSSECKWNLRRLECLQSCTDLELTCIVHLVYCRHIYPVRLPPETNICCSTAVRENSTALLYAIFYYAAAHEGVGQFMLRGTQEHPSGRKSSSPAQPMALRYKAESLHHLNQMLTQSPPTITEGAILCISILRATEAISGDVSAIAAHTSGISRMVEAIGGIDQLSPSVRAHLCLVDIKAACVAGVRPSLAIKQDALRRFDKLFAQPIQLDVFGKNLFGSRFFMEPVSDRIGPELRHCLQYTRRLALSVEVAKSNVILSSFDDIENFLALEHRLLSLPFYTPLSSWEDCIRIAVLLYLNVGLWNTPLYFAWVESLVSRLKVAAEAIDVDQVSKGDTQVMLWVLLLGRYASGAHKHAEKAWFTDKLLQVVKILGVFRWLEARVILKGFFYLDRVFCRPFEKIWALLMVRSPDEDDSALFEHSCPAGKANVSLRKFFGAIENVG